MNKLIVALFITLIYHAEAKAWPGMMVRRSSLETLLPKSVHTLTDCMHVTSEDGIFIYRKVKKNSYRVPSEALHLVEMDQPNEQVCGVYLLTDPDKIVEVEVEFSDVNCELGGLLGFVDGWEMNGEYFPNINDHELPLEQRFFEFCDKPTTNPLMRKAFASRKRKFISNQNGAVFQYKIPFQGSFAISVRYIRNPKPCNIMAEGVAPYYVIQNYGTNRNCTVTALFPAVVSILAVDVGGSKGNVNYDCDHLSHSDKLIVGGSNGLDSSQMTKSSGICGKSDVKGPEQAIFCGVTSIRLESSGKYNNKVFVSLRQADENDLNVATAVCDL